MALLAGADFRQELRKDTASTLEYQFNIDGVATTADTSVSVTIKDRNDAEMPAGAITSEAGVIAANVLQYSLAANQAVNLGENYRAEWAVVHSAVTYYRVSYFDIVMHPLEVPITIDDILAEQPDISNWTRAADTAIKNQILAAHQTVKARLRRQGARPYLVIDQSQFYEPYVYLTLEKFCRSVMREPDDKYAELALIYEVKFESARQELKANLKYDHTEDLHQGIDEVANVNIMRIKRA